MHYEIQAIYTSSRFIIDGGVGGDGIIVCVGDEIIICVDEGTVIVVGSPAGPEQTSPF